MEEVVRTHLFTIDHDHFRGLVGSGETGLADRLSLRHRELGGSTHEAVLDDLREIIERIEARGSVEKTGDAPTDRLVNRTLFLLAEEAGIERLAGGPGHLQLEQAERLFSKKGFLRKPWLEEEALLLLRSLRQGRVYGGVAPWDGPPATAFFSPPEVRQLFLALSELAARHGRFLPGPIQNLLDQDIFPPLEATARASLGLLAVIGDP